MDEARIRAATAADIFAITDIVDQAYRHYISHIGKPPGPMLDDYAARVSECKRLLEIEHIGLQPMSKADYCPALQAGQLRCLEMASRL